MGNTARPWRIQVLKMEVARLCEILKLTDFALSFTLKNVEIGSKGNGHPPPPLNTPLIIQRKAVVLMLLNSTS